MDNMGNRPNSTLFRKTEIVCSVMVKELPVMFDILEKYNYFIEGSICQKQKTFSILMSIINDYDIQGNIIKEEWVSICKYFLGKIEILESEKGIYLELISDIPMNIIYPHTYLSPKVRDIYLCILESVFTAEALNPEILPIELYDDLCDLIFYNVYGKNLRNRYLWEMTNIHKENTMSVISNHLNKDIYREIRI